MTPEEKRQKKRQYDRQRYADDPAYREKQKAAAAAGAGTPARKAYMRAYAAANRERLRGYGRARRAAETPEERSARYARERERAATPAAKAKKRTWYEAQKDKQRARFVARKFELTPAQVAALRDAQNAACAICGRIFGDSKDTHIDHCHATGRVRGLLCNHCNRGLGCFRDRPEALAAAITYLQRHATLVTVE